MSFDKQIEQSVYQQLPLGMLVTRDDVSVVWANDTLCRMLACQMSDLQALEAHRVIDSEMSQLFRRREILKFQQGDSVLQLLATYQDLGNGMLLHCYMDISEGTILRDAVNRAVTSDDVTGLPNRYILLRSLDPMVSRCRRYEAPLTVSVLRICNLAELEQQFDADAIYDLSVCVARFLRDQTRWADMVGRYDQDTFLFLLQETKLDDARNLMDKLLGQFADFCNGNSVPVEKVSLAAGVAGWEKGDSAISLIKRAITQAGG
jgi:diguanylate cyclase (GGDEF)-like protein